MRAGHRAGEGVHADAAAFRPEHEVDWRGTTALAPSRFQFTETFLHRRTAIRVFVWLEPPNAQRLWLFGLHPHERECAEFGKGSVGCIRGGKSQSPPRIPQSQIDLFRCTECTLAFFIAHVVLPWYPIIPSMNSGAPMSPLRYICDAHVQPSEIKGAQAIPSHYFVRDD